MSYKVLTDGNGSGLIRVVGLGDYMPFSEYQKAAARANALNALVVGMQARASLFLQPDGEDAQAFIEFILGALDGPEQRRTQVPAAVLLERPPLPEPPPLRWTGHKARGGAV